MRTSYAVVKTVENAYLVRDRDRRRNRELARVLWVVLPLAAVLLGYIWLHARVLATAYRIQSLEAELERLDERERHLLLEAAYLEGPTRLEAVATGELGLEPPSLERVVFFEEIFGAEATGGDGGAQGAPAIPDRTAGRPAGGGR